MNLKKKSIIILLIGFLILAINSWIREQVFITINQTLKVIENDKNTLVFFRGKILEGIPTGQLIFLKWILSSFFLALTIFITFFFLKALYPFLELHKLAFNVYILFLVLMSLIGGFYLAGFNNLYGYLKLFLEFLQSPILFMMLATYGYYIKLRR